MCCSFAALFITVIGVISSLLGFSPMIRYIYSLVSLGLVSAAFIIHAMYYRDEPMETSLLTTGYVFAALLASISECIVAKITGPKAQTHALVLVLIVMLSGSFFFICIAKAMVDVIPELDEGNDSGDDGSSEITGVEEGDLDTELETQEEMETHQEMETQEELEVADFEERRDVSSSATLTDGEETIEVEMEVTENVSDEEGGEQEDGIIYADDELTDDEVVFEREYSEDDDEQRRESWAPWLMVD